MSATHPLTPAEAQAWQQLAAAVRILDAWLADENSIEGRVSAQWVRRQVLTALGARDG